MGFMRYCTMSQVLALHQFDCARANKSTASWGVEARVPFLDVDFIEEAMMTNPEDKMISPVSQKPHIRFWLVFYMSVGSVIGYVQSNLRNKGVPGGLLYTVFAVVTTLGYLERSSGACMPKSVFSRRGCGFGGW